MSVSGMQEMKVAEFGGLNTLTDATNLPVWASPDCQDVEFYPGLVKSRPGTSSVFATLAGNPTVNYLKTFVTPTLAQRLLALDSLGNLYKENPIGTLANISSAIVPGTYMNSVSQFGREYLADSDGKTGLDIPRQYDDTNLDRVSQIGPGRAPSPTDESGSYALAASPGGVLINTGGVISGVAATCTGNIATLTLTPPTPNINAVGDLIKLSGFSVAGYNGTWPIAAIVGGLPNSVQVNLGVNFGLANATGGTVDFGWRSIVSASGSFPVAFFNGQLVTLAGVGVAGYNGNAQLRRDTPIGGALIAYNVTWLGLAASGNGTVSPAGNITAGTRKVTVAFVTEQGFITCPAPPISWTAIGDKRVVLTSIPKGPLNIVARIILFTASGGNNFFYVSDQSPSIFSIGMIINDNVTTSATFDFTDQLLLSGTSGDSLFNLVELGECSGVTAYSSRLFWWGERNKVKADGGGGGFNNLSFDGGFTQPIPSVFPLGWIPDPTSSTGGTFTYTAQYWGGAYGCAGDGVTAIVGKISQPAAVDYLGAPILVPNTAYSVRARIRSFNTLTQGTLHINLQSTIGSFTTTGISLTAAQVNSTYAEFIAPILSPQATIPSDIVLQIYADGTPTNNGIFFVDCVEIFPTNQPYNNSQIRASFVENPESFDGVTGFLNVAPENGQAVKSCFVIRNNLYIAKERSLYVTQDDGTNEPADWSIQEISEKVGTPSVRGVGVGDEWAIIAAMDGVYYFTGGPPQKISQEIQPTWNNINWTYGHLINVTVDTKRKRVYITVPYGSSTVPNKILTLDYTYGFQEPQGDDIQQSQNGIGRRWSPWALSANSISLILRPDNTQKLFLGNGAATGKIYQLDESNTVFSDDGAVINAYWQPGYFQDGTRLNYGYVTANVVGSGTCNLTLKRGDQSSIIPIRGWIMSLLGYTNMERQIQKQAYRMSMIFGVNTLNSYFSLQGFSMWVAPAIYGPVRGINS